MERVIERQKEWELSLKNIAILKQGSAHKCAGVSPERTRTKTHRRGVNSFSLLLRGVRTVLLM